MEHKIDYFIEIIIVFLSAIFGKFWILFVSLLILNILDYFTGIMKAKYLKKISSKKGFSGAVKKCFIWVLVFLSFTVGIAFKYIGEILQINLNWLVYVGYLTLIHCIINEICSILENIVECDKGDLIPKWLIRGLAVFKRIADEKANQFIDKFDNKEDIDNE